MKHLFLFFILIFSSIFLFSQKKAVTETGEEVILYDDGTWKYKDGSGMTGTEISTNPKEFKKPATSTFLVKSTKLNVGVWIDPKKWSFNKGENNEDAEYEFDSKGKDLYGMMISEGIEIPVETLKTVALENARSAAPDVKISKEEYRVVNNNKVLFMQMDGTAQGIKFSYYGYYYSNNSGTLQFVIYTSQNLLKKYSEDMEELLNGLVVLEN